VRCGGAFIPRHISVLLIPLTLALLAPLAWLCLTTDAPRPWRWVGGGVLAFVAVVPFVVSGLYYAPVVEELAKATILLRAASAQRGAAVGAGFAAVEGVAFATFASPLTMLARCIGAVPLHIGATATAGAGLARGGWWSAAGVGAAIVAHAAFNIMIIS